MSFWGKIAKIASISMIATGGALTVASSAMLGVGTNYTYSREADGATIKVGVGSMNYGKTWVNGQLGESDTSGVSYQEFVNESRKAYKELKKQYDALPEGDQKNQLKEMLDLYKSIFTANDLMIAGAVLLPIFTIVLAAGIALIIINKKKS